MQAPAEAPAGSRNLLVTKQALPLPVQAVVARRRGEYVDRDYYLYPPIAYFTLTESGTIIEANLAGAAMLGVPKADLSGQSFARFVARNDATIFDQHRRQILNSITRHTCVIGLVNTDGTHFLARLEGTIVRERESRTRVWRAAVTDLRVRVRGPAPFGTPQAADGVSVAASPPAPIASGHGIRIDLARQPRPLKDVGTHGPMLAREAKAPPRPVGSTTLESASMLAHELVQPLTAIINYVEACRRTMEPCRGQIPGSAFTCMDKAVHEASRAGQLMHRLRRLVEKGETKKAAECINETIKEAMASTLADACDKGVKVQLKLASALPGVLIDKIQIQQVIVNLVRNGIEALANEPERLLVIETAPASARFVEVTVSDSGSGLCPEVTARLFQPIMSRKAQGMGIGLSICRTIIGAHGGEIWATPGPNGGTAFHFTLPVGSHAADG